jgi:hypothetical protein
MSMRLAVVSHLGGGPSFEFPVVLEEMAEHSGAGPAAFAISLKKAAGDLKFNKN